MRYPSTEPVVITCALTGGIHGKEANENLPEQPDEIVEQGIRAVAGGRRRSCTSTPATRTARTRWTRRSTASCTTGCARRPTPSIQLTTGGSPRLPVEERLNTVYLEPEMCSLNMGLLNFFIRGEQVFFANHRSDIERFAHEIARARRAARARGLQRGDARGGRAPARARDPRAAVRRSTSSCTRRPRAARAGRRENLLDAVARLRRARRSRGGPAGQRHVDGRHAAADDDDRDGDGLQRARRDGGQRALPPRRTAARATRSSSSGRCGSRPSSTGRSPRPAQARELLALRGRPAEVAVVKPPPFAYAAPASVSPRRSNCSPPTARRCWPAARASCRA